MRRMSLVLIAVGAFLIVLAPMIRFYAYPRLAVAPANEVTNTGLQAVGARVFDIATLKTITADLKISVVTHGDASTPKKCPGDVTYVNSTLTNTSTGKLLSGQVERMTFDKRTGQASTCGNDFISDDKDAPPTSIVHQGLVAIFPFNTQKKTYQFWDSTLRKTFPIMYQGTTKVEGMTVYDFSQTIPPTEYQDQADTPLSILGLPGDGNVTAQRSYSVKRDLLVEPETGVIIKRNEAQLSTLNYQGEPRVTLTDAVITYDDKTIRKNIDEYGSKGTMLHLTRATGPQAGFALGLLMLIGGVLLGRRRQQADGTPTHEKVHAHA